MPRNVLEGNRELSKCGLQAREGGAEAFELISKVGVSGLIAVVEEWTGLSVCSCSTCTYCYAITEPHLYIILAAIVDERCAWIRLVEHDCSASTFQPPISMSFSGQILCLVSSRIYTLTFSFTLREVLYEFENGRTASNAPLLEASLDQSL